MQFWNQKGIFYPHPLTPGAFCQICIFGYFRDLQSRYGPLLSSNLEGGCKKGLWNMIANISFHHVLKHFCLGMRRNQFGLFVILIFFCLSFPSFSDLFVTVIDLYWACFQFKNLVESIMKTINFFYELSQAPLSRSLWPGYHWKYFFLLQNLDMPILVKGDDVRSGTKANACLGQLLQAWKSVG